MSQSAFPQYSCWRICYHGPHGIRIFERKKKTLTAKYSASVFSWPHSHILWTINGALIHRLSLLHSFCLLFSVPFTRCMCLLKGNCYQYLLCTISAATSISPHLNAIKYDWTHVDSSVFIKFSSLFNVQLANKSVKHFFRHSVDRLFLCNQEKKSD